MSLSSKLVSAGRLSCTLADIGPKRLLRRFRYEIRQRLDNRLPLRIALAWAGADGDPPEWRNIGLAASGDGLLALPPASVSLQAVSFDFLNKKRKLSLPIRWNNPQWSRLWQFHLHYFDWARKWLNDSMSTGHWTDQSNALQILIDSWIASNPPGQGDGWHSYTLSLRTRN